jgi:hypothetical protein
METQNKYTSPGNIVEYFDRKIFARLQKEKEQATYYFECEDHNFIQAVTFHLAGGTVSSTMMIPRYDFTMPDNIKYIYNGNAR